MQEADERSRLLAFQTLLDGSQNAVEPRVPMTALRKLCARGIPDHPRHLRPLAYSILLGTQTAEKRAWRLHARGKRADYHTMVKAFMDELDALPTPFDTHNASTSLDTLLTRISKDVDRAAARNAFLRSRSNPSRSSPLSPASAEPSSSSESDGPPSRTDRIRTRRAATLRLEALGIARHRQQSSLDKGKSASTSASESAMSPRITLSPEASSSPSPSLSTRLQATMQEAGPHSPALSLSIPADNSSNPPSPITLLSPKPLAPPTSLPDPLPGSLSQPDTHAECLLRLLYVVYRTNPFSYSPNLFDILLPLYLIYAEADVVSSRATRGSLGARWAEEDTFWTFTALVPEFGDIISPPVEMGARDIVWALERLGRRVRWADEPYWVWLRERNLDPAAPLYASQWLSLLLTREAGALLAPIWDFILSEPPCTPDDHPKVDILIDLCAAMLITVKDRLVHPPRKQRGNRSLWAGADEDSDDEDRDAAFQRGLQLLRAYPMDQVGLEPILQTAYELRQARTVASLNGDDPDAPGGNAVGSSWAADRLREATQSSVASTSKLWSSYRDSLAQSDAAASLQKASSNWTAAAVMRWADASKAAASASTTVAKSAPAADWRTIGAAAGRLIGSMRPRDEDAASASGEEDLFASPPSTPRSKRDSIPPVPIPAKFVSPKNTVKYAPGQVPASIAARRGRSDSVASGASVSALSLQDRLSSLASALTGTPAASEMPRSASGPRPLLLSGSARRASNASVSSSRHRGTSPSSPASVVSPPPGRADDLQQTPGLYRIGSRSSGGTHPTPRTPSHVVGPRRPINGEMTSARRLADATASPASLPRSPANVGLADVHRRSQGPPSDSDAPKRYSLTDYGASESDAAVQGIRAPAALARQDSSDSAAPTLSRGRVVKKRVAKRPVGLKLDANGAASVSETDESPVVVAMPRVPPVQSLQPPEPISIPTPQIGHLTEDDYERVYEPAEDSFILLDALEADAAVLRGLMPALCVEIGGIASTFLTSVVGANETYINRYAAAVTLRTGNANGVQLNPVLCNLLDPFVNRMKSAIDLLIFNPPYVETDETEMTITQRSRGIGGAWAGGEHGMMVTDLVLAQLPQLLAPGGRFYLVAVQQNKPDEIIARMVAAGLECKTVLKRRAGREHLCVIRMIRPVVLAPRNGHELRGLSREGLAIPSPLLEEAEARTPTLARPRSSRSPRAGHIVGDSADMADDEDEGYGALIEAYGS